MTADQNIYKCVNCGQLSNALYKQYGPSVLKLTVCANCGNAVDKYVEYDPVIVMVDLCLISKAAQRHILYNTKFEAYWKLFLILVILETYGVWKEESIINLWIDLPCSSLKNQSSDNYSLYRYPYSKENFLTRFVHNICLDWSPETETTEDPFLAEKEFYIAFAFVSAGTWVLILSIHILTKLVSRYSTIQQASFIVLLKAVTLGSLGNLLNLPIIIWGNNQDKSVHVFLVFCFSILGLFSVLSVLYDKSTRITLGCILSMGHFLKYATIYLTKYLIDSSLFTFFNE